MPAANVTTPVNYPVDSLFTPTDRILDSAATMIYPVKILPVVRTGLSHLTLPAPIRQWTGTEWEYLYRPRM